MRAVLKQAGLCLALGGVIALGVASILVFGHAQRTSAPGVAATSVSSSQPSTGSRSDAIATGSRIAYAVEPDPELRTEPEARSEPQPFPIRTVSQVRPVPTDDGGDRELDSEEAILSTLNAEDDRPPVTPRIIGLYATPSDPPSMAKRLPVVPERTNASLAYLLIEYPLADPVTAPARTGDRIVIVRNGERIRDLAVEPKKRKQWIPLALDEPESEAVQTFQARLVRSVLVGERLELRESPPSRPVTIERDVTGPRLLSVRYTGGEDGVGALHLNFDATDLDPATLSPETVRIEWLSPAGMVIGTVQPGEMSLVGDQVRITLTNPRPGRYRIRLPIDLKPPRGLQDRAGNPVGLEGEQTRPQFATLTITDSAHSVTGDEPVPAPDRFSGPSPSAAAPSPTGTDGVMVHIATLHWNRDVDAVARTLSENANSVGNMLSVTPLEHGRLQLRGSTATVEDARSQLVLLDRPVAAVDLKLDSLLLSGRPGKHFQQAMRLTEEEWDRCRDHIRSASALFVQAVRETLANASDGPDVWAACPYPLPLPQAFNEALLTTALLSHPLRVAVWERFEMLLQTRFAEVMFTTADASNVVIVPEEFFTTLKLTLGVDAVPSGELSPFQQSVMTLTEARRDTHAIRQRLGGLREELSALAAKTDDIAGRDALRERLQRELESQRSTTAKEITLAIRHHRRLAQALADRLAISKKWGAVLSTEPTALESDLLRESTGSPLLKALRDLAALRTEAPTADELPAWIRGRPNVGQAALMRTPQGFQTSLAIGDASITVTLPVRDGQPVPSEMTVDGWDTVVDADRLRQQREAATTLLRLLPNSDSARKLLTDYERELLTVVKRRSLGSLTLIDSLVEVERLRLAIVSRLERRDRDRTAALAKWNRVPKRTADDWESLSETLSEVLAEREAFPETHPIARTAEAMRIGIRQVNGAWGRIATLEQALEQLSAPERQRVAIAKLVQHDATTLLQSTEFERSRSVRVDHLFSQFLTAFDDDCERVFVRSCLRRCEQIAKGAHVRLDATHRTDVTALSHGDATVLLKEWRAHVSTEDEHGTAWTAPELRFAPVLLSDGTTVRGRLQIGHSIPRTNPRGDVRREIETEWAEASFVPQRITRHSANPRGGRTESHLLFWSKDRIASRLVIARVVGRPIVADLLWPHADREAPAIPIVPNSIVGSPIESDFGPVIVPDATSAPDPLLLPLPEPQGPVIEPVPPSPVLPAPRPFVTPAGLRISGLVAPPEPTPSLEVMTPLVRQRVRPEEP